MPHEMSLGLICATHFSCGLGVDGDGCTAVLGVESRVVRGRLRALLVSVPKKMVFVASSYDAVAQTVLVAGPK